MDINQFIRNYKNKYVLINGNLICEIMGYYNINDTIYLIFTPVHTTNQNILVFSAIGTIEMIDSDSPLLKENLN